MYSFVRSGVSWPAMFIASFALWGAQHGGALAQDRVPAASLHVIEGEALVPRARGAGAVSVQNMHESVRVGADGWSKGAQLLWDGGRPGATLDLVFGVRQPGEYALELYFSRAPDYALLGFGIDGQPSRATLDTYSPNVSKPVPYQAGSFALTAGRHVLNLRIDDKYPQSSGYRIGLDQLKLYPVRALSAEEAALAGARAPIDSGRAADPQARAVARASPQRMAQPAAREPGTVPDTTRTMSPNAHTDPQADTSTIVAPTAVKLAFGIVVPDSKKPAWGGVSKAVDDNSAFTRLVWQAPDPGASQWRWQLATQAFPAGAQSSPPGLLAQGGAGMDHFAVDLKPYLLVKSRRPAARCVLLPHRGPSERRAHGAGVEPGGRPLRARQQQQPGSVQGAGRCLGRQAAGAGAAQSGEASVRAEDPLVSARGVPRPQSLGVCESRHQPLQGQSCPRVGALPPGRVLSKERPKVPAEGYIRQVCRRQS